MMRAKVLGALLLLISSIAAVETEPLKLSSTAAAPGQPAPEGLTVTNISTKPVEALALRAYLLNEKGQIETVSTTTVAFENIVKKATAPPLMPGESRMIRLDIAGVSAPKGGLRIELDYVLFRDGSHWGADKSKRSIYIAGLKAGSSQ